MEGYLDYQKYVPTVNRPLELVTRWGLRKALRDRVTGFYRFTDCTHPFQNCNCNMDDVQGWRYENPEDNEALLFQPNHYAREKEGELILSTVRLPKPTPLWINKILFLYFVIFRFRK